MAGQREILQLLRDYAAWRAAFGGAFPWDESAGMSEANYGPAGIIFTGAAFKREDRARLEYSYRRLNAALRILRRDHMPLWASLVEPYLSDTADPGVVAHWRKQLADLDRENRIRRKGNPKKPPKVALVFTRELVERHDKAIARLAEMLKNVDLHYVPPKLMSQEESKAIEDQNAEIYAVFQRFRAAGTTVEDAAIQTAGFFSNAKATPLSADAVFRVVELRDEPSSESFVCMEPGCSKKAERQGMCWAHYERPHRVKKNNVS